MVVFCFFFSFFLVEGLMSIEGREVGREEERGWQGKHSE